VIYGSVCSGIEAASLAFMPLGWRCAFVSEVEAFPQAVLRARYGCNTVAMDAGRRSRLKQEGAPWNFGDFTTIRPRTLRRLRVPSVDLLVGGTPCQAFSVAGERLGLDDPRGNLTLEFLVLVRRLRPRWVLWENVPGVLSIDGGRTFGTILGTLGKLGYGVSFRVLDAQYFGVPQRRRRVFVVGHLGAWQPAAAVLFEPESLRGDSAPGRATGEDTSRTLTSGSGGSRTDKQPHVIARSLNAHGTRLDGESETFIADTLTSSYAKTVDHAGTKGQGPVNVITHTLRADGFDASEDGTGRGTPLVQVAVQLTNGVRRLTPRECERLMGVPDDYTAISTGKKDAADGPRYRVLGNSFAVPVVRWIAERIAVADAALRASA